MSSVFFKVFSVCHFFQFHHLKSGLSCAQCPHSLLFHLILLKNIILSALQNLPAAALDKLAAFPKTKCSLSSIKGVLIDESNRNCQTDRRPWPRCHSQGDPPHHENPRGRPAADSIDTVGKVLLRNGRFGQTEWVEVVHNDENGSDDRRYSRRMNHGNESPGSIAAQRIRAIFSVSIRLVRVIVIRAFALLKCHWYGI